MSTSSHAIPTITTQELVERYDGLLIDAYGVLVHRDGAFPGASAWVDELNASQTPYMILTNDASRSRETAEKVFRQKGLTIPAERIITSGSLIEPYFEAHNLAGSRCVVMGPEDSATYVRNAGGEIVSPMETDDVDVVVACDDAGYPFLETIEATLTVLFRRFDAGKPVQMLLPNPDLIYPKNETTFGLTSGSVALILEAALQLRYLRDDLTFIRLGKPHTPIYEQGVNTLGTRNVVMIGDQLRTDILGANRFGIDSVLISTGLAQVKDQTIPPEQTPTYLLPSL